MVKEFIHTVDGPFGRVRVWARRDGATLAMDQRVEIGGAIKRATASVGTFAYADGIADEIAKLPFCAAVEVVPPGIGIGVLIYPDWP